MPTVLRIGPYRFHFYSDERNEPPHIHVRTVDSEYKFWLDPIVLAKNRRIPAHRLNEVASLAFSESKILNGEILSIPQPLTLSYDKNP